LARSSDHVKQAESNEKLASHLEKTPYADWRCTVLFYAALHYIQAYFGSQNPALVFERHSDRDTAILEDSQIKPIRRDYRALKDWSQNARYKMHKPSVSDFGTDIEPSLISIKRHLKRFVPEITLDN
jgi:hypothetical protein